MAKIKKDKIKHNAINKVVAAKNLMNDDLKMKKRIDFINKFVLCEIACKHIVEAYKRQVKELKPGEYVTLDMRHIPTALSTYDYSIPRHTLNEIFGGSGNYKKRGTKSAKKLRDGIMHAMNENDLDEIIEREESLNNSMDSFLTYFRLEEDA